MDILKAFNTVTCTLLTEKINNTNMDMYYKIRIANYLIRWRAYTLHKDKPSTTRRFMNELPQGSVFLPTLRPFSIYASTTFHPDVHILSYADDMTLFSQHPKPESAATHLQENKYKLEQWLHTNKLNVSQTKFTWTLNTPWSREYNTKPPVTLNTLIPQANTLTIPGGTYDIGITFNQHSDNINNEAKTRLNVLRALTNTSFGHFKEDITRVYKQCICHILWYAHPA